MPRYFKDEMEYQIAITIKTIAGIMPARFIRLFTKLDFFSSFFIFLTGSATRLMVFLFDMVIRSFSVAPEAAMSWHI
jgi:hypothetical protein